MPKVNLEIFDYIRPYLETVVAKCPNKDNLANIQTCIQSDNDIKQFWNVFTNERYRDEYREKFIIATLLFVNNIKQYDNNTFENITEVSIKEIKLLKDKFIKFRNDEDTLSPSDLLNRVDDIDKHIRKIMNFFKPLNIFPQYHRFIMPYLIVLCKLMSLIDVTNPDDIRAVDDHINNLYTYLVSYTREQQAYRTTKSNIIIENLINNRYKQSDVDLFNFFFNIININGNVVNISNITISVSNNYRINLKKVKNNGIIERREMTGGNKTDDILSNIYVKILYNILFDNIENENIAKKIKQNEENITSQPLDDYDTDKQVKYITEITRLSESLKNIKTIEEITEISKQYIRKGFSNDVHISLGDGPKYLHNDKKYLSIKGGAVYDIPLVYAYFPNIEYPVEHSATNINIYNELMDIWLYEGGFNIIINSLFPGMTIIDLERINKTDMLKVSAQMTLDGLNNSKINFNLQDKNDDDDEYDFLKETAKLWQKDGDKYYHIDSNSGIINKTDVKMTTAEFCTMVGLPNDEVCERFIRAIGDGNYVEAKEFVDEHGFTDFKKSDLKNLNPSSVINVLTTFKIQMREYFDKTSNTTLMKFEPYESWLATRPDDEKSKLESPNKNLKQFLKAFIFFINSNPKILNPSHNGESDEQRESCSPPDYYIERSINPYKSNQSKDKRIDWHTLSTKLPGLNTMSPGMSFDQGSPFGSEYFPPLVLPQMETRGFGQLRGMTGFVGGYYDTASLYTDLKSRTIPSYGSNIEELLNKLKVILLKYHKEINNSDLTKIEKNITKFKDLEQDLYKNIVKISEYGKKLELNGDMTVDHNVTVNKMEKYIKVYKDVERKFMTTQDFLREIYNLLESKSPSNENVTNSNKVDINITH